ncbi:MAG TPA: hypothetical protein VNA12_10210 [Mycobacteriales bacterium]|nr:hypothetical protein [Mycobacteriales bacterium]
MAATRSTPANGRSWHVATASALVAAALLAPTAHAGDEGCGPTVEPVQAETLDVRITVPPAGLARDGETVVDVEVRRDTVPGMVDTAMMAGSHVSLRVKSSKVTSFVDGALDAEGAARVVVTLDRRTTPGAATLIADVWTDTAPHHGCQHVVREHGAAQVVTRVNR